jgi:hypothetical protein
MKRGLINQIHNRVAQTAVGPSALRNQGGRYVVQRAREFLRRIDLSRFNVKTEAEFRRRLDKLTEALRSSLPPGARNWGTARKALNLFLRDAVYSFYLREHYDEHALAAVQELRSCALALIRMLAPQDFELLVDLVFTTSGWRRVGVVGRTQDTLDIDLLLPSTGERAFVQVKSKTTSIELAEYIAKFGDRADLYSRMFYVYHSGTPSAPDDRRVTLIGPEHLADLVVDAGLTGWLIEKVS